MRSARQTRTLQLPSPHHRKHQCRPDSLRRLLFRWNLRSLRRRPPWPPCLLIEYPLRTVTWRATLTGTLVGQRASVDARIIERRYSRIPFRKIINSSHKDMRLNDKRALSANDWYRPHRSLSHRPVLRIRVQSQSWRRHPISAVPQVHKGHQQAQSITVTLPRDWNSSLC